MTLMFHQKVMAVTLAQIAINHILQVFQPLLGTY